jgi:predicted AAA+ superfamily ATPase
MRCYIDGELEQWAEAGCRHPQVICGPCHVGKTHAAKKLGRERFASVAYVDLSDQDAHVVFEGADDARRILTDIGIYTNTKISPHETLIVLDEIQWAPKSLTALKTLADQASDYPVVATSSYFAAALNANGGVLPEGVEIIDAQPLSFLDFLNAKGEGELARLVEALDFDCLSHFEGKLQRSLREYLFVGGMPGAVRAFIEGNGDFQAARTVQEQLIQETRAKVKQLTSGRNYDRIRLTFESIPVQIGEDNHKFIFGHITSGARAREFAPIIKWLVASRLARSVCRVDEFSEPLEDHANPQAFKLFLPDVGLFCADMGWSARDVLLSNKGLEANRCGLIEQFACQQLVAAGHVPYYWSSRATSQVSFVCVKDGRVVPIEVQATENQRKRSLRIVHDRYGIDCLRASFSSFERRDWLTSLPLWAIGSYFNVKP